LAWRLPTDQTETSFRISPRTTERPFQDLPSDQSHLTRRFGHAICHRHLDPRFSDSHKSWAGRWTGMIWSLRELLSADIPARQRAWPGNQPPVGVWESPPDTKQPHAQGCRDPFAFLTALITKMHACSPVYLLTFSAFGVGHECCESAYSFE
jgi:hypothetical protein